MSNTDYPGRFLHAVGSGLNLVERALANKLHDYIRLETLAVLIAHKSTQDAQAAIKAELHHACYVGQLKAARIPGSPGIPVQFGSTGGTLGCTYTNIVEGKPDDYIVHRDNARRYFQWLDAMPDPGTPLWCWLRGKPEAEAKAMRADQQDKADFQQLAIDDWAISPEVRITGPNGIVEAVGRAYLHDYTTKTVEGWAREVAPEGVKGKCGRPKKLPADPGQ
jgi:hypothetical protein